jgi:stage V sporulation protein D (sporulation-specific penicillin-binding protein)
VSKKKNILQGRLRALLVLMVISIAVVACRLCYVQVVVSPKYSLAAEEQRFCEIEITPKRGTITDRNGTDLGVSVMMDTIYVTPRNISDLEGFVEEVAPIINVDKQKLLKRLTKQQGYAYLVRKTDEKTLRAVKDVIEKRRIKGAGFIKESQRYYPNASLASHVLGFTGMENHGLSGLELYYDELLYGKPGRVVAERDGRGKPIPQSVERSYQPVDGATIRLSIDKDIQYKSEIELVDAVTKYKARSGSIIVIDPKDGEIYAMANSPSYNSNDLKTLKDNNSRNIAVTDIYEPGSTMKVLVASGALEEGLCGPGTAFYLEPTIKIGSKIISDAHSRPAENFSFSEIIEQSSNVGMVKVGSMMGRDSIIEYLEKYGFDRKTGIDFPGEAKGFYPKAENWSKMSLANIPFGQGICTTQIQMVKAFSVIANNGRPVTPHFLLEAKNQRGRIVETAKLPEEKQVIDLQTCEQMKDILEKTVVQGTGQQAKVPHYRVGGKTGTAQKAKVNNRGYEKGKYVASFIGMAPIEDPRLLILVVIDEPQASIYGGSVAAPVFSKVAEFSLRHLRIPPQ